jgi:RNase P/RNase MRP subunit p30
MIENVNNNSSQSEQTIHFVENVRTRNNTYRQKDIILFLHESLDLMTKLIESIRVKLIEHQYRNTVRSPIDIPHSTICEESKRSIWKQWRHSRSDCKKSY